MNPDKRVEAIRQDSKVGRHTCSVIDECYEDSELIESLDGENITSPKAAVRWARRIERLQREQEKNQSWD